MSEVLSADTYAQATAAVFSQVGKIEYAGPLAKLSATMPLHVAAFAEAVSARTGLNRSKVLSHLAEAGMRTVREHMSPQDEAEIMSAVADYMARTAAKSEQGEI